VSPIKPPVKAKSAKSKLAGAGRVKAAPPTVYQFKITLLGSEPPIWRRIHVANGTLDQLHEHIQAAMGWTNSHLHQFEIGGQLYGDPALLDDNLEEFSCIDSTVTRISEIVGSKKRLRLRYEYDFGDGWDHEVLLEGCHEAEQGVRYPRCVEGARACPPEDVGGVWGYADLLAALADPAHEQHEEYQEWLGDSLDPEQFDAESATVRMRRGLRNSRRAR
jgi:hypothetical protein